MDLENIVRALCLRAISEREMLTDLDQAVGDGDFGTNIERGARAVLELIGREAVFQSREALLVEIAKTVNAAGCGTAGTLISLALMAGARQAHSLDEFCSAALAKIQSAGRAQIGDKTMLDALEPAVQALNQGDDIQAAAAAARIGVNKTRQMIGKKGRSLYSQSRAKGVPDPGAHLIAILFDEAALICGVK